MKKRELPQSIFLSIYRRWQDLPHRERKKFLAKSAQTYNVSVGILYRRIRDYNTTGFYTPRRRDAGSVRVADKEKFERDMLAISGVKHLTQTSGGGYLSTPAVIELLTNSDAALLAAKYSATTVNRHLKKRGLAPKNFTGKGASFELKAKYPNHVWAIDATVAASFYLREKSSRMVFDPTIDKDTQHREDRLQQEGLKKIWLYVGVDWFSGLCSIMAFADYRLGENASDWYESIRYFMLPKPNNPMQGVPEIFLSDKGNPYKAGNMQRLTDYFSIRQITHAPGNSGAKGKVERRIGVVKQVIERRLTLLNIKDKFDNIEQFNHFLQTNVNVHNDIKGYTGLYTQNLRSVVTVTNQDINDAFTEPFPRTIDAYGCISVDGHSYFVASDLPRREKVNVLRRFGGELWAQDAQGRLHRCDPAGKQVHYIDEGVARMPKTESDRLRAMALVEGANIKNAIIPDDIMLKPTTGTNVVSLPPRKQKFNGGALAPAEIYHTAEEAWLWLSHTTGLARGSIAPEIVRSIDNVFAALSESGLPIDADVMLKLHNILNKEINQNAI